MNKKNVIRYEPLCGMHIEQACKSAIEMARRYNRKVQFGFNSLRIRVHKRLSVQHVVRQWEEMLAAHSRRYRNSLIGKHEAATMARELKNKQRAVEDWLLVMGGILKSGDETKLMVWMRAFAELADDNRMVYSKMELARQLETSGYIRGEYVGKTPEWLKAERPRMARYIIGQVLDCLLNGMSPHPVTVDFVDDYFKIPSAVICVGDGSEGAGCGYTGGRSGSTCSVCHGMMLSKDSIDQAASLAAAWARESAQPVTGPLTLSDERYSELMKGDTKVLSPEEIQAGWHFCPDWDCLLIGPGMGEMDACTCNLKQYKNDPRRTSGQDSCQVSG